MVASLLVLAACSRAGESPSPQIAKTVDDNSESFLFVMQAGGGGVSADDPNQKTFAFTLRDPDPMVIFLSDRPKRLVGHLPLQLFVQSWNLMGFGDQPPEAALIFSDGNARESAVIVQVTRPQWDASAKSLSFQARIIQGDQGPDAPFTSPVADSRMPASFGHLSLFIDPSKQRAVDFAVTPNGVIELRQHYAQPGSHPIEVVPVVSYIGPNYYGNGGSTATPTPVASSGAANLKPK